MKIGIVSMQRIKNYGSFLQAYALKQIIRDLGHSVTFIDFLPGQVFFSDRKHQNIPIRNRLLKKRNVRSILGMVRSRLFSSTPSPIFSKRKLDFQKNFDEYLKLLDLSDVNNYATEADLVIIGSDEVFNCTQKTEVVGFSRQLFGQDLNTKKVISYAASFGYTTLDRLMDFKIADQIAMHLNTFAAISVRDNNSFEIVRELTGKIPELHVDPVLLYNYDAWIPECVSIVNYILVYAYPGRINSSEEVSSIKRFAKEVGKDIITVGIPQAWCNNHISATPFELVAYIKNADYIITDTFHGAVFSIKYNKPFAVFVRQDIVTENYSNEQKVSSLLGLFGLNNRLLLDPIGLTETICRPIDFDKVNEVIKYQTERSVSYLSNNTEPAYS